MTDARARAEKIAREAVTAAWSSVPSNLGYDMLVRTLADALLAFAEEERQPLVDALRSIRAKAWALLTLEEAMSRRAYDMARLTEIVELTDLRLPPEETV